MEENKELVSILEKEFIKSDEKIKETIEFKNSTSLKINPDGTFSLSYAWCQQYLSDQRTIHFYEVTGVWVLDENKNEIKFNYESGDLRHEDDYGGVWSEKLEAKSWSSPYFSWKSQKSYWILL